MSLFCSIHLLYRGKKSSHVLLPYCVLGNSRRHYLILSSKMGITDPIIFLDEETEVHGGQIT